jgi:hypothetical protein
MSLKNAGVNNPMYGKIVTEETRAKLRAAAKLKDKPSRELVEKRANSLRGFKQSADTKKNLSEAWKKKVKLTCAHCGIVCPPHLHNRWHGSNCKHQLFL